MDAAVSHEWAALPGKLRNKVLSPPPTSSSSFDSPAVDIPEGSTRSREETSQLQDTERGATHSATNGYEQPSLESTQPS